MYLQSVEVEKVIDFPEWVGFLNDITYAIDFFNVWYDFILATSLFGLPIILIILIRRYQKSVNQLPKIYRLYLPDKIFKADFFPLLIGMSNGYFIFFLIFFIVHNPVQYLIIPLLVGLMIPIMYFINYIIRGGKSKEFSKKFWMGTLLFLGLMILAYLSV